MVQREYKSKKSAVLLILAVCLLAIRLTGTQRDLTLPEQALREVLLPLQEVTMRSTRQFGVFVEGVAAYPTILEEKQAVEEELARVLMDAHRDGEVQRENIRLRRLLGMAEQSPFHWVAADVVARNIKNWDDTLIINRGSRDGIRPNDAVMTYMGLVGKVAAVTPHSAEVRLLNDRTASVAAMTERSRFPAVIEGIGDGSGLLQLSYLPYDAPISVNENVITSGLGGETPKGIRIGFIRAVEVQSDGLIQRAIVQPHEDYNRLEEVLVITGIREDVHEDQ